MALAVAVGREEELLEQLRALLFLPSPAPAPATPAAPVKVESATGPLPATIKGSRCGHGPAAVSSAMATIKNASSCGGGGRRRQRLGSKRDRDDEGKAKDEQHDEDEPAAAQPLYPPPCKRRKKKQQSSKSLVTSVPDFDGYQWIEEVRAEADRRRHAVPQELLQVHTERRARLRGQTDGAAQRRRRRHRRRPRVHGTWCTWASTPARPNHSQETPVILETTTVVIPSCAPTTSSTTAKGPRDDCHCHHTYTDSFVPITTGTSIITTGTKSPAISGDDITTCWSSCSGASSDHNYTADDHYCGGGLAASSLQETMEDLTGPIRSPVHVPALGWTIDQLLLQLVDEPVCHF